MTTGFVLVDRTTSIPQCRFPRRSQLSGVVGVHTAEGAMDTVGIDTGAENVANFIVNRSDYGSYHVIVDSDSAVRMAPDDYETWHIAADAHNWHAWGISAACRSVEWDPDSDWTKRTIARMGKEIREFWIRNGFDPQFCARWLTRAQALAKVPGLIHHGVAQPSDRSDAWVLHPRKAELDAMLVAAILSVTPSVTPQPPLEPLEEPEVLPYIIDIETTDELYVADPVRRERRVITPDENEALLAGGMTSRTFPAGGAMHRVMNEQYRDNSDLPIKVDEIASKVNTAATVNVDLDALAERVADKLAARLQS